MNYQKIIYLVIYVFVITGTLSGQKPVYIGTAYSAGLDYIKIRNSDGAIFKENDYGNNLIAIGLNVNVSYPLYESLSFRSDLMFLQTDGTLFFRYEEIVGSRKEIGYHRKGFANQSVLNAFGLSWHHSEKGFMVEANAQGVLGVDVKKEHSFEDETFRNSFRTGFQLGSYFHYVGKYMGFGVGIQYTHLTPEGLFNNKSSDGLSYSSRTLMYQLSVRYKLKG